MSLRALDMTLKHGVLNVLTILFLFGCQGEQEMTFNIPKDLALVSTTVTDSTPTHSATTLYLEEDEVQYSGGVYIMPLEKNNYVPDFDSAEPYSRGDYVVYSGVASSLERDVSQAINVPLTASSNYDAPTFEQLIEPNTLSTTSRIESLSFSGTIHNFIIKDGIAYCSGYYTTRVSVGVYITQGFLVTFDISTPNTITQLGYIEFSTAGSPGDVSLDESGNLYVPITVSSVPDFNGVICVVDVSTPTSMTEVTAGFIPSLRRNLRGIAIDGSVLYVTAYGDNALISINIANPAALAQLHAYTTTNLQSPIDVSINGGVAFVLMNGTGHLMAIDQSTPSAMVEISTYTFGGTTIYPYAFKIKDDIAYIVGYSGTTDFIMVDTSNPALMSTLQSLDDARISQNYSIDIKDNYAYIVTSVGDKIVTLDISGTPKVVSSFTKDTSYDIDGLICDLANETIWYIGGNALSSATIPTNIIGNDVGLYNYITTKYSTHMDITVTRISDSVVMATGEFYYLDSASHISRYYGTGCTTGCGANRLVWIGDDKVYVFTASYTHTNGAIAADFRNTYLAPYGFTYVRPTRPNLPFDTKQYTSVVETGNQTWVVKSLTAFNGVALGRVRGDTISITFKDSIGATVGTPVVDQTINNIIDTSLPDAFTTEIFYASSVIEANGTVEITIKGTETEIGKIFPTASYVVGSTNLQFSHEIVDFSKEQVSAISGAVDRIEGNKVIDYKGSYDIEMVDYDTAVMLQKYMTGRLVAIDGSDMINNEVADGQGRFASTKIICRIRRLSMKSTVKDDDIAVTTPISFEFREIV